MFFSRDVRCLRKVEKKKIYVRRVDTVIVVRRPINYRTLGAFGPTDGLEATDFREPPVGKQLGPTGADSWNEFLFEGTEVGMAAFEDGGTWKTNGFCFFRETRTKLTVS